MERVYAFPVFANAAFMGPIFGPVVGGFIGTPVSSRLVAVDGMDYSHYIWPNPRPRSSLPARNLHAHPSEMESGASQKDNGRRPLRG